MSSVLNFFKKKIKPFKKCSEKSTIESSGNITTTTTVHKEKESILTRAINTSLACAPKRVSTQTCANASFKAKKRCKNLFTLKLKKNTNNTNLIQEFISSDIVVVSNEYPSSPLVNSTKVIIDNANTTSVNPIDMSVNSIELTNTTVFFNDWSTTTDNLLNASSKNYLFNEKLNEHDEKDDVSMLTYKSRADDEKIATETNNSNETTSSSKSQTTQINNYSFTRTQVTKRRHISPNLTSKTATNLDRSLSINEFNDESDDTSVRSGRSANQASKRKCRRSNTTVATHCSAKSNSIIDYFNKLELINPVRKKERLMVNYSNDDFNQNMHKIDEVEKMSITSQLNTTTSNKNDIEKIQDLFFDDGDSTTEVDEYTNYAKKNDNMVVSSYMDSPVSSNGLSPTCDKKTDDFFHMPSSSSPASDLLISNDCKSIIANTSCHSIERLRRSISTPGLKDVNASIFSNISNIQIKEYYEVIETDLNNNKDIELSEKSLEANEFDTNAKPQFIRGGKTRSSKNIKQLFKNVVKYQMNALNSLEKFYESQLNKLEADRKQNLKLNPQFADKINEFYDRQLNLLEERVQSNLTLICENKRNRLSTASSSSTIQQQQQQKYAEMAFNCMKSSEFQKKCNAENMAKIVAFNHLKQQTKTNENTAATVQIKSNANSRTLNDLKLNLKNKNTLLPSKSTYNKMAYNLNESSPQVGLDSPVKCRSNISDLEVEYTLAKYRSPKQKQQPKQQVNSTLINQFYKKQSILQSPATANANESLLKIETPQKKEVKTATQFQYQKNKIKRYSTSNENLAQIAKINHVRNNMARIVRLNRTETKETSNLVHQFKKHQSVCSLDSNYDIEEDYEEEDQEELNIKSIVVKNEYATGGSAYKRQGYIGGNEFRSVNSHDALNYFEVNNNFQTRLSDSHLWYELRQQHYQKKCSRTIMIETKV